MEGRGVGWAVAGVVWLSLVTLTDTTRTIMAINAGGDTTIAADGEVFERDRYYQGGVVSKKGKDLAINGTNSPALYQTERFAIGQELWYSLPIPFNVGHNGRGWTFVLTLKFVEVQFNATGRRMFGVNLNGLHVLRDIDVFSMAGWATAYDEHIEFRIDPDHYAIWVTSVGPMRVRIEQPAAFYGDLHVALTPTEFGNARLCAMQLTQGTLEELDAAAEQADPSRRRLSSKKEKKTRSDNGQRILLLLGALAAAMLLAREIFGWKFKKRPLPAKLRGKGGSQPANGRRAKGEKQTPPRSQKNKERSSSTDGNSDQSAKRETKAAKGGGKGSSKASPENHKSEPKPRAESPRAQAKREERSRQKKEQRDRQKEKSRQESMRAEAEALAQAKAVAESAARRSAAALAALEEATAAEAAAEAVALREKAEEAVARREAAKKAEVAARAEAKQAKAKLKKRARKAAAKLKAANSGGGAGSPASSAHSQQQASKQQNVKQQQQQQQQQHPGESTAGTKNKGAKLPSSGSSSSLSSLPDTFEPTFEPHSLGVDWSHTDGGAGSSMMSRLSSGSNSSFGSDEIDSLGAGTSSNPDNGDLDIDVFAMLQDEIMSRDLGLDAGSSDSGALDESRLLSNLVDFLDTDESDTESLADSSYSGDDFFGPLGSGAAANQLSASAPEFTPTGPPEGSKHQGDGAIDVSALSVEVWMEAHELSQYTSNLLDAGLKTVGDLLAMPLTHDHLKSLGLTKLRGRLLLMNSLKSNAQRRGE